jgi:hypothetical protein
MLYLYLYNNDSPRQSNTPPTTIELTCVSSGILQIFRWYVDSYEYLVINSVGAATWEKVENSALCSDALVELGEYHA